MIVLEIREKYSEWIESYGDKSNDLIINILANQLAAERSINEYYKRRLDYVVNDPAAIRRVV